MARRLFRTSSTCRSSKPSQFSLLALAVPAGCDWDASGMRLGCWRDVIGMRLGCDWDAGGMQCDHPSPEQPWAAAGAWPAVAEGGRGRLQPDLLQAVLAGERHCASRCAGAAALGALPAAPGAAIVPLLPFSARGCPRPHCSCRKLALKTHPKPPRPSTAGDCYWPQLPPLCLITSIWGCGKM